jgi:cell wall-active antibiotic response 4TMS protein YvqF
MESPLVVAQRAAIQEARARYERGEISVDVFREALDRITEAPDVGTCEAIIAEMPHSPLAVLAALEPAPQPATPAVVVAPSPGGGRGVSRITAFMGETKRAGRPWTLAPNAHIGCVMGEVRVDLRSAKLPPQATLHVAVTMGETRIIVPRGVRVTARTRVIMGEATVLGETISGMVASGEEEHEPPTGEQLAEIEIHARVIMGELKIVLADSTDISIAELARETLRAALVGVRDGLASGAAQRPALNPGATPSE